MSGRGGGSGADRTEKVEVALATLVSLHFLLLFSAGTANRGTVQPQTDYYYVLWPMRQIMILDVCQLLKTGVITVHAY